MKKMINLEDLKDGDVVWISGVSFSSSGRTKFNIKPRQTKISRIDLSIRCIEVDYRDYYFGNKIYSYDLNKYLSLTKEESIKKYNDQIKCLIEESHSKFRTFEKKLLGLLI